MTERDFRINGRDWEPLGDSHIEDILDDTGSDNPAGDYSPAEVYALAREVRQHRQDVEQLKAFTKHTLRGLVIDIRRYVLHHGVLLGECVAWEKLKKLVNVGQTTDCPSERGME